MTHFESPQWTPTTYEREPLSDAEIAWRAEQDEAEAHLQYLVDRRLCTRCESRNTWNSTGEYDAVGSYRCDDCGYMTITEW